MNPFLLFNVFGIMGITVANGEKAFPTNCNNKIKTVEILQEDNSIVGIRFILNEGISIDISLLSYLESKAQIFVVNILGRCGFSASNLSIRVGQTYDPANINGTSLKLYSTDVHTDSAKASIAVPIKAFKEMFEQTSPRNDADYYYSLFYNTMKIDNIVVRYLMQYELLLSLVAPNRFQSEIKNYLETKYNPIVSSKIGFRTTRKAGKTYDEDDITFYRNLLGHNKGSDEINEIKLNQMSHILMQVLFFAIYNI